MLPWSFYLRAALIVLAPIAIYTLVIARINRRPYPTAVSGVADCAGLLLAFAGVLLYLGPGLLTGFNFWPRDIWLYNHYSTLRGVDNGRFWWRILWLATGIGYSLVIGVGVFVLLWRRRHATAFYNVNAEYFEELFPEVFQRLGVQWTRSGPRFLLTRGLSYAALSKSDIRKEDVERAPGDVLTLEFEGWKLASHVTLYWSQTHNPLRTLVENALTWTLQSNSFRSRPATNKMMIVAACLFVLLFVITVAYQFARFHEGKW